MRMDFDVCHPPTLVWRALTDQRQLARWFMPGDLEPVQDSRFQLRPLTLPGFDGPIYGQVLEVSAERRLAMRWTSDQLHLRVTWELTSTPEGCRLTVSQSGFFGVGGSRRRQALLSTYDRLFGERLPAVLDGLAGKGDPVPPRPSRLPAPVPARPDRRRQLLAVAAAALLIGLVAAVLPNLSAPTSRPVEAEASGTSGQPAPATVAPTAAASSPPAASSTASSSTAIEAPRRPPGASLAATRGSVSTPPRPAAPRTSAPAERATTTAAPPRPPPAPAALAARYSTLSTGLLTYRGEVVVRNTGGTTSDRWTLTITVPLLASVRGVAGPRPSLSGTAWAFRGAGVPAGGSARVVFDVLLDVGSLLGATRPLSCRVSGEDCAGF
jgi:uncharacterized protein YndB with AHSA1/START domain